MSGTHYNPGLVKQLVLLLALPLTLCGTGYALFSQQLSINTSTTKPLYSASQYIYATYTKTETPSGSNTNYSLSAIITNKGVTSVTAWQVKFDVPSNVATVTCSAAVTCTKSGVTVTVVNGAGNGTVAAGASTAAFTISFTSATAKYTLQNVYTSATLSTAYQNVAGLTVSSVKGTSTKAGRTWTHPYTFTVTNSSGQNLSGWQALCTWTSLATTSTISTNVNYVTSTARITFTSKTALNTGNNIVFTGRFTKNSSTWVVSSCTVQGRG